MVLDTQLGNLAEWINIIAVSLLTWYFYKKKITKKHGSCIEILNLRESLQKKAWSM